MYKLHKCRIGCTGVPNKVACWHSLISASHLWIFSGVLSLLRKETEYLLGCGQSKTFEEVTLGSGKQWHQHFSKFSDIFLDQTTNREKNRLIVKENNHINSSQQSTNYCHRGLKKIHIWKAGTKTF